MTATATTVETEAVLGFVRCNCRGVDFLDGAVAVGYGVRVRKGGVAYF